MGFDLKYLLFLQNIRESTGGLFDEIMNGFSKVAVDVVILLPFVIYWCMDRKWGYRGIITMWLGEVVNGIIKLTVCAYRPWIRSDLIEPAGDSKVAATGYSFPSGHTMCATTTYGTISRWQWVKRRWISWICVALIVLTGFSRNFLGVHTPQDVFVGIVESVLLIIFMEKVMDRLSSDQKFADIMSIAAIGLSVLALVYVLVKPYPMDYVDGQLLVNPVSMQKDIFKGCGALIGIAVGSYIERHKIHYEIPKGSKYLPIMAAIGGFMIFSLNEYFLKATVRIWFGTNWGSLVGGFILTMFGIVIWPLVIKKACSKKEEVEEKKTAEK